jgi:hypothetical protein
MIPAATQRLSVDLFGKDRRLLGRAGGQSLEEPREDLVREQATLRREAQPATVA